ncbi:flagellar protein FliO/FliZ [Cupriavidus gilardii J11]|uniref:Flagellar protein n=1 Tax=Cupriavidus gilardii J11 TaxID=936133 RepID=A0A562BVR0_9BURK|nr:flagellar protein FliO/FliZ [Cupriavidus gilardii J11]
MIVRQGRGRPLARARAGKLAMGATSALPAVAHAADAVASATGAGALAQAGLGLFAVIALILGLAWFARRAGLVRHVTGGVMKVIGSTTLGARQRLLLVEVGDTWLVLGVSAGEIRTLHTLPAGSVPRGDALAAGLSGTTTNMSNATNTTSPASFEGGSFAQRLLRAMQQNLKS